MQYGTFETEPDHSLVYVTDDTPELISVQGVTVRPLPNQVHPTINLTPPTGGDSQSGDDRLTNHTTRGMK